MLQKLWHLYLRLRQLISWALEPLCVCVSVCTPSASAERGNTHPARSGSWGQQVSFIIQNCCLTFYLLGQRTLYSSWLNFLMMKPLSCQIIKLLLPSRMRHDFLFLYLKECNILTYWVEKPLMKYISFFFLFEKVRYLVIGIILVVDSVLSNFS